MKSSAFKTMLSHPYLIFFFLVASSGQGILVQYSFFIFETQHVEPLLFIIAFSPLILSFLLAFLYGFNVQKSLLRIVLLLSVLLQLVSLILFSIFMDNTQVTLLLFFVYSFFSAYISIYSLNRSLCHIREEENMTRQIAWLVTIWFGGQAIFGLIFYFTPSFAFIIALASNFVGLLGLFFRLKMDENVSDLEPDSNYTQFRLIDLYSPNLFSLLILFIVYTFILFSFIPLFSTSDYLLAFSYSGKISLSVLAGIIVTTLVALIISFIKLRISLRVTYQLAYLIISLSIILLLFYPKAIILVYFIGILMWPIFGIFILNYIVDMYPKPAYIRIISIWWMTLSLSFGGGILAPFLILNTLHLLYFEMLVIFITIFLLNLLSTANAPLKVHEIAIFTPIGTPIYNRGQLDVDESLLTGLLSGIMTMFKEVFKSGAELRYIDHGDKKLVIRKTDLLVGALLLSHVENNAVDHLNEILSLFEAVFHRELIEEPNHIGLFANLPDFLEEKINNLKI